VLVFDRVGKHLPNPDSMCKGLANLLLPSLPPGVVLPKALPQMKRAWLL
jgi:hypothetical protein